MNTKETSHKLDRSSIKFCINDYVQYGKNIYKITQIIDFTELIGINIKTNVPERLLINALKSIEIDNLPDNGFISRDLSDIADDDWKEIEKRYDAIKPLLNKSSRREIEEHSKRIGVHFTTLYRWLNGYKTTGTITGLLPQKAGRKEGTIIIENEANQIINQIIQNYYLTRIKPSVQTVINKVFIECSSRNITTPSANTIRNRINKISEYERLKRQGNKEIAETLYGEASGKFKVDYPLQVIQIDHTEVDVILLDDETRQPIGRPWITLAIDVYSRMITGYHLSLDAPCVTSVGLCIINSILPKDDLLLKFDINSDWNIWGIMQTIFTDNGADFRANSIRESCLLHGINFEFRPLLKKNWGGHIERLIGTVMKQVHNIPGTTFSNIQEKMTYDSDKNACMTFNEFEKWLISYITRIYHKKFHSGINMSPETKWKEGIFGTNTKPGIGFPAKPNNNQSLIIDFLPSIERTIQKDGVTIDGLKYYDSILRTRIKDLDKFNKNDKKYIFKRDPRDISHIWFYENKSQIYYKIPFADQSLPSMNLHEYKLVLSNLKNNKKNINTKEIYEAYEDLYKQIHNAETNTKKIRRFIQKNKINSEKMNIEYKKTIADNENLYITSNENDLWDDEIPEFD